MWGVGAVLGLYFGTQVSLVVACWLSSCSMDLVASSHPHHPIPSQYNVGVSCVFFFFKLPWWLSGQRICLQCRGHRRCGLDAFVRKIPWRRKQQHTPVLLAGKSHGQRSLVSYGPWDHKESDTTKWLVLWLTFSLVACGIFVPRPWIKPMSPALKGKLLTSGTPGKSLISTLDTCGIK